MWTALYFALGMFSVAVFVMTPLMPLTVRRLRFFRASDVKVSEMMLETIRLGKCRLEKDNDDVRLVVDLNRGTMSVGSSDVKLTVNYSMQNVKLPYPLTYMVVRAADRKAREILSEERDNQRDGIINALTGAPLNPNVDKRKRVWRLAR